MQKPPHAIQDLLPTSRLDDILKAKKMERAKLDSKEISRIISENKSELYGKMNEVSKFLTLSDLCEIIRNLPEKNDLPATLLREYETVTPLQGEPENWNEVIVKSGDGALGLIVGCLLEISGNEAFDKMVEIAQEKDDLSRMKVIFNRIRNSDDRKEYLKKIQARIDNSKSEEMNKLLREYGP